VLSPSRALQLLSSFHSRASPTATAACYLLFSPYCAPSPLCSCRPNHRPWVQAAALYRASPGQ
jgi:hypothetical protein